MLMAGLLCGALPNLSVVSLHPRSISTIKDFVHLYIFIYICMFDTALKTPKQYVLVVKFEATLLQPTERATHLELRSHPRCLASPAAGLIWVKQGCRTGGRYLYGIYPWRYTICSLSFSSSSSCLLGCALGCYNKSLLSTKQCYANTKQLSPATPTGLLTA